MSRLIVKGLPSKCTEEKLRQYFGKYGQITDCTLKYTKAGKFRRFAFLGFESDENARKAQDQLHGTFMGTSRLMIEECKPFGDETKPRAWSKYAKGSSAYKRSHPEEAEKIVKHINSGGNDSTLSTKKMRIDGYDEVPDFLELDKKLIPSANCITDENNENDLIKELLNGISGNTSLSVIVYGLPKTVKSKGLKDWFSPIRLKGMKFVRGSTEAVAFVTFFQESDTKKALKRSEQFFGGSRLKITKVPNEHPVVKDIEEYIHETKEAEIEAVVAKILDSGRLFVRNLPYICTEEDLQYLFKKYGEVSDLQIIINKKTGQCKGFAIVTYVFPESAVAAYSALDGSILKGRMLHILPGEEKRETEEVGITGKSAFQKAKLSNLKKSAGKAHSWNTLFLGANAVAETLAEKLEVEKRDLLLGEGETSAGVRLALAETRLVRETREYLLAHGVCLDVFSRPATNRSKTVIVVKNLTAKVEASELRRMFERHGPVKQILLPPGCVTAVLEMGNVVDAQKAFNALAYARFRSQPLFLEWAPCDIFKSKELDQEYKNQNQDSSEIKSAEKRTPEMTADEKKKLRKSKKHRKEAVETATSEKAVDHETTSLIDKADLVECTKEEIQGVEETHNFEIDTEVKNVHCIEQENEILPGTTLFVKNLNFKTTDEELANKFKSRFPIRSATISKKLEVEEPTKTLSMGFGFVTFYRPEDAEEALKEMQGILLDGHCLELKLSHREVLSGKTITRKEVDQLEQGEATKILIRNIPFQASRKEVQQLFSTFGEIRSFRMPRKVGASAEGHRGFGFVDFLTRADARRAFNALVHSTHFYGRRLVLEWAKPDSNVEELREKAIANLSANKRETGLQKKMLKKIAQDLIVIDDD
ncbi:unnamed protein product [Thelazia callipaeda]|uniref:RNA-binding protein 19 n=1 Tax=Thelazia callipaeda TaxID=103827 RepID=A0A0N5D568_THECL|nr:unnamed protein product [Thelazia callipaeda]